MAYGDNSLIVFIDKSNSSFDIQNNKFVVTGGTLEGKICFRAYDSKNTITNSSGTVTISNPVVRLTTTLQTAMGMLFCSHNVFKNGGSSAVLALGNGTDVGPITPYASRFYSDNKNYLDVDIKIPASLIGQTITFYFIANQDDALTNQGASLSTQKKFYSNGGADADWRIFNAYSTLKVSPKSSDSTSETLFVVPAEQITISNPSFGVYTKADFNPQYSTVTGTWLNVFNNYSTTNINVTPTKEVSVQNTDCSPTNLAASNYIMWVEKRTSSGGNSISWNKVTSNYSDTISNGSTYEVVSSSGTIDQGNGNWFGRGTLKLKFSTGTFRVTFKMIGPPGTDAKNILEDSLEITCVANTITTVYYELKAPLFLVKLFPTANINNTVNPNSKTKRDLVAIGTFEFKVVPQIDKTSAYLKEVTVTKPGVGATTTTKVELCNSASTDKSWISALSSYMNVSCEVVGQPLVNGFGDIQYDSGENISTVTSNGNIFTLTSGDYKIQYNLTTK